MNMRMCTQDAARRAPRHLRAFMLEVTEAMMAADLATPQFFLTRLVTVTG